MAERAEPHASVDGSTAADLDPATTAALFELARASIDAGLRGGTALVPHDNELAGPLAERTATFVTVLVRGELNGCIGSIEAEHPLGVAVARHAWSAAFADPRLPPLRRRDARHMQVKISVLSPLRRIAVEDRRTLERALRPDVDGLVIASEAGSAVFLPVVWRQLPHPDDFLDHLFRKAGLLPDEWPPDLRAFRFDAVELSEPTPAG